MEKKIILITGSSDGIGKETAKELAAKGYRIIMHGRNPEKTKAACAEVRQMSGNDDVDYILGDLMNMANIVTFANEVKKEIDHLDILINNAGAQFAKKQLTDDGHERTMAINVLSPYLLTTLLMPLLRKSKSARVITVSSAAYKMSGKPDFDNIDSEKNYSLQKSYGTSKLYVIWMMWHYAKVAKAAGIDNVTFNLTHPGSAKTSLARDAAAGNRMYRIIAILWNFFVANTVKAGAYGSVYLATAPEMEGVSGKFIGLKGEETVNRKYWSAENEQRIWDWCVEQTKNFIK